MNESMNPRSQVIIALVVVLLAAAISWKAFYHDPHAELASLNDQVTQATTSRGAGPKPIDLHTADKETIKAAKSATTPISSSALRQRIQKGATASGIKVDDITGSGGELTLEGSGSDAQIAAFLVGIQGDLHLDQNDQIRGSGPLLEISSATLSGRSPQAEQVKITVASAK